MTEFLVRHFVKDYENVKKVSVRTAYGVLASVTGIFCNVFLFVVKWLAGYLMHSISVMADAFNNLSDAGSSIIGLVGVKIAEKPADEEHPFGHGRIEYIAALIVSWVRYGKPDVSLTFNGALAGLVAITAGCDVVDPFGAAIIGIVAGVLCIFSVEFFDNVAKIDDPVGAVSVHCMNGAWGTIAVGLFATEGGLFYGGGFAKLGIQLLGIVSVAAWVLATMFIIFTVIKKTIGLRVSEKEEIDGLDYHEHGLASAYAGFAINDPTYAELDVNENTDLGEDDITKASPEKVAAAVKVVKDAPLPAELDSGMHKVSIIVQLAKFETLKKALNDIGVTGMTVTQVMGCGLQKGSGEKYRGAEVDATLLPKVKVEVVVSKIPVDKIIDTATKALYTGHIGDGKIFVYNVAKVVKVRTGEQDYAALQDVE